MYNVLIASLENWDTLAEMPYLLKKGGCTVDILCAKNQWLKANGHYNAWIESEQQPEKLSAQLIKLVRQNLYDWVILGDEPLIKLMNEKIKDEDLFRKMLPLIKIENRNILSSKVGLSEFCQSNAITAPRYMVYQGHERVTATPNKLRFPLIVKNDHSWGGYGISLCSNEEELLNALRNINYHESIIVQEYIKGKEIPVEALYWKGELISYTVSEILSQDKGQFSYSTRRNYFGNKSLEKTLSILGQKMGINGFANLAYIYAPEDNNYYLIEADLRPNSWMNARHVQNVFIEGVKRIAAQISSKHRPVFTLTRRKIEVALFYKDIRRCIYNRDVKGLRRWLSHFKYWQFVPLYDRQLFSRIASELSMEFLNPRIARLAKYPVKTVSLLRPQVFFGIIKKQYASLLNMTN